MKLQTTKAKYFALMEIYSILLMIGGAVISTPIKEILNPLGWFGAILVLLGIISYIAIANLKDKKSEQEKQ